MTQQEYKEELQKNIQKLHSEMNKGKVYEERKVNIFDHICISRPYEHPSERHLSQEEIDACVTLPIIGEDEFGLTLLFILRTGKTIGIPLDRKVEGVKGQVVPFSDIAIITYKYNNIISASSDSDGEYIYRVRF